MITSIVIATYNKLEYTQQCIESIRSYTAAGTYEIIVVDNASTDGSVDWLRAQPDIRLIANDHNEGFPRACNQGIQIAHGDILLLNNDTVVTSNWLNNMRVALYSSDLVGAVGCVTNSAAYYQAVPVDHSTLEEMQAFAASMNHSNSELWEERLKLIGFCMLVRKSIIDRIGGLDERFSPGNYEDDDYSLRIRLAGYRLILCKDTFIHHFGSTSFRENKSYAKLMQTNRQKFMDKWGFDPDAGQEIVQDLVSMIRKPVQAPLRILEIGCLNGGTLLRAKDLYREAELFGVEAGESSRTSASLFAKTAASLVELMEQQPDTYFDVILVTHGVDKRNGWQLLETLTRHLLPDGVLLVRLSNSFFYRHVHLYLQGKANDEQLASFRAHEVEPLFYNIGMKQVRVNSVMGFIPQGDEAYIKQLAVMSGLNMEQPYRIHSFYVRSAKMTIVENIAYLLTRLVQDDQDLYAIEELLVHDADEVVEVLNAHSAIAVDLSNLLGVYAYAAKQYDWAYRILLKAVEMNPQNDDSLFNLASVLYEKEQYQLAYDWVQLIQNRNQDVERLASDLLHAVEKERFLKVELKQLLRRIEFNVQPDAGTDRIIEWLHEEEANVEVLFNHVSQHIIAKAKVLNVLAIASFEQGRYDEVLPLLQNAHEWEPEDCDTLYNLGYLLYTVGEHELARRYLRQIQTEDAAMRGAVVELEEMLA